MTKKFGQRHRIEQPDEPAASSKCSPASPAKWQTKPGIEQPWHDWSRLADRPNRQANDKRLSNEFERHFSLIEVAARLDVSVTTLYREIDDKKLKATKIRGQWRISESQFAEYRRACERRLVLPGHRDRCREYIL